MKKEYVKPMARIEYFSLSQSVATACGVSRDSTVGIPTQADKHSCGWSVGGDIIWVQSPTCNDLESPDTPMIVECYNNPNGGTSVFNYS